MDTSRSRSKLPRKQRASPSPGRADRAAAPKRCRSPSPGRADRAVAPKRRRSPSPGRADRAVAPKRRRLSPRRLSPPRTQPRLRGGALTDAQKAALDALKLRLQEFDAAKTASDQDAAWERLVTSRTTTSRLFSNPAAVNTVMRSVDQTSAAARSIVATISELQRKPESVGQNQLRRAEDTFRRLPTFFKRRVNKALPVDLRAAVFPSVHSVGQDVAYLRRTPRRQDAGPTSATAASDFPQDMSTEDMLAALQAHEKQLGAVVRGHVQYCDPDAGAFKVARDQRRRILSKRVRGETAAFWDASAPLRTEIERLQDKLDALEARKCSKTQGEVVRARSELQECQRYFESVVSEAVDNKVACGKTVHDLDSKYTRAHAQLVSLRKSLADALDRHAAELSSLQKKQSDLLGKSHKFRETVYVDQVLSESAMRLADTVKDIEEITSKLHDDIQWDEIEALMKRFRRAPVAVR